jgi:hypothetical protein
MTAREDTVPELSMELSSEFHLYYIANTGTKYELSWPRVADA